jgi:putative hemolysin
MWVFVSAVAIALIVSFVCSIFESVLLSIGHAQIEGLARSGSRAGQLLKGFKRNIDVPIAAILIVNTIAHTIGSAVAGASYADVFDERTLWLFTIVFTAAVLLFTEIVPKTLGVAHARSLAGPVAYGIRGLTILLKPLVLLTEKVSRALRGGRELPVTTVEEIRLLAALGRSEGVVGARTAGIIVGATRLAQLHADDVMVPRHAVRFMSGTRSLADNLALARTTGHSRFPFSPTADVDQVSGIVLVKELLFRLAESPYGDVDWTQLAREPLIIPAGKPLNALLRMFRETRLHMAVVVDDYGEVKGIVALEDVLEEIVGEIDDESDRPVVDAWTQADGSWRVLASADLRRVCEQTGVDWDPGIEAASVGGLVTELLGRLPVAGDLVEWNGLRLTVLAASPRRAELVAIERLS